MKAMKKFVWLSFDLGVRGDYEGIYTFLDAHGAKECGDSLGGFTYEFKNDLIDDLTKDLKKEVKFDKRSRVYVIYLGKDGKLKGRFIIGGRRTPPWAGRAPAQDVEEDVGE
jgi:hypothetical protein